MKNLLCTAALLALVSTAGGCTLYFGGDDGDDICAYGAAEDEALAVESLRNPDTGGCEDWDGGGGGGGCGATDWGAPEPTPDWASCWGYCEGLDEGTCLVTSGCRAAYGGTALDGSGGGADADCAPGFCGGEEFMGCWGTAPTGPIQGGGCAGLDAYACSLHDDCTAHYYNEILPDDGIASRFSYCADEGWNVGCYSNMDCPVGYECNAAEVCGTPPGCESGEACPDVCYGSCQPAANGCELVDCAMGSHCEVTCFPCDSADPSDPTCDAFCETSCVPDSWTCEGVDCGPGSHCEEVCDDSVPGSCWSSCVPDDTTPACETILDETACDAREDCIPTYTGFGCTCEADGTCSCMSWEYARCEPATIPF